MASGMTGPEAGDHPSPIVPQRAVLVLSTPEHHDSRSLRIAATLAGRGHRVTILARRGPGAAASDDAAATDDAAASGDSPDGYRVVRVGAPPAASASHPQGALGRVRGEVERLAGIGLALRRQVREAAAVDPGADLYHGMAYQGIPIALSL
ncbi:MAG TPA: hypothetical protein VIK16_04620, partial [Candidatus Limnocylindrales bacterium]